MGFADEPVELLDRPELLYLLTDMWKLYVRDARTGSLLKEGLQLLLRIRDCMQWLREYVETTQVCVGYAWYPLELLLGYETHPLSMNEVADIAMSLDSLGIC